MELGDLLKNVFKKYIDMIKKYIAIAGAGAFGFILLICVMAGGIAGGDESMSGSGSTSGTANASGMSSAFSSAGAVSLNETSLTREDFVQCIVNFRDSDIYQTRFAQYAGTIYDICTSKNINPLLCVAQAKNESDFGASTPANSPWNYWGIGVYNDSNVGREYDTFEEAVSDYCNLILGYQQGSNDAAKEMAQQYAPYTDKITGNMDTIYDIFCAYAYLGDYHSGRIWDGVNAKKYLVDYMHFNCTHAESDPTTMEERAAYAVDYVDNHIIANVIEVFGEEVLAVNNQMVGISFGNINLYNADGSVNENAIQQLEDTFEADFGLVEASDSGRNTGGGDKRYNPTTSRQVKGTYLGWDGKETHTTGYPRNEVVNPPYQYKGKNGLGIYQCTWWANGRASIYIGKSFNVAGNGGDIYDNAAGKYARGSTPKPNSLVAYKKAGDYGHVAYVEAVDYVNGKYYISHAGGGRSWYGVQKLAIGAVPWSNYTLAGFVYLDEPLN